MDLMSINIHVSASLSQIKSPPSSSLLNTSHLHSSHNGFPIIVIAIIGILATAFLLLGYYIFVIKCCLNWHRIDILGRFSLSRNRRNQDPLMGYSPAIESRGLDESVIRSIPIFQFKKIETQDPEKGTIFSECAVCLNEFHEQEKLRMIPNCNHLFHIDCIDVWLQNNANCPLCRTSISLAIPLIPVLDPELGNHGIRNNANHDQELHHTDTLVGLEEDYVVIELGDQEHNQEKPASPSQKKIVHKIVKKRSKKIGLCHSSMGDECIDIRVKDERLSVQQPIRRSFSMDSATDRQLYLAVQEIVNQNKNGGSNGSDIVSSSEACSSKIRRSFFSFGHGRGSRRAGLAPQMEP